MDDNSNNESSYIRIGVIYKKNILISPLAKLKLSCFCLEGLKL